jgi:transposase-like protein
MGISAKPIKVDFTCKKCKKTFDTISGEEAKHWVT